MKPANSVGGNMEYFPPPDSLGGWRTISNHEDIKQVADVDSEKLDSAFDFVRTTTRNGGLLVVRHGYLVYERYFGKGQRNATPNLGSCGKSFTSIAVGILMDEYPHLFPLGLDQKIFTPDYFPSKAFPLSDPRKADIKLGQLLSFTAGIRGNNPVYVYGKQEKIDPVGPDGWYGLVDDYALGLKDGMMGKVPFSTKTLWCDPGGGYSYSTAAIHDASIMLHHITGMELEDYVKKHLAEPLGWGRWSYGYKYAEMVKHTPGGGGIALRSTDMLRFCYLLLHKGRWNGKQIVPEEYIQKASKASPYNPHYPYSLQFNVNTNGEISELPRDAFWKIGSGGHCLYVVPSMDMVVWKLGGRDGQYSKGDTGLPEPEPLPNTIQAITGGPEFQGDVYSKTLEMVINAFVDEDINQ
ncbi:MAG TPA: serine hydrolase [Draconibacterium sp.]|nr:serine hydrolase [Draconibacterium sp.]